VRLRFTLKFLMSFASCYEVMNTLVEWVLYSKKRLIHSSLTN